MSEALERETAATVRLLGLDALLMLTRRLGAVRGVRTDTESPADAPGLKVGLDDLEHGAALLELMASSDSRLQATVRTLGLVLLAPSLRRRVSGPALREALAALGPQALEHIRRPPADPVLAALQTSCPLDWEAFSRPGADAALQAGWSWLARRAGPTSPALWQLLSRRLPMTAGDALPAGGTSTARTSERSRERTPVPTTEPAPEAVLQAVGRLSNADAQADHV